MQGAFEALARPLRDYPARIDKLETRTAAGSGTT